eukprot:jgi/Psemu1/28767/gm1.28767_g
MEINYDWPLQSTNPASKHINATATENINMSNSSQIRDLSHLATLQSRFADGYDSDGAKGPFYDAVHEEGDQEKEHSQEHHFGPRSYSHTIPPPSHPPHADTPQSLALSPYIHIPDNKNCSSLTRFLQTLDFHLLYSIHTITSPPDAAALACFIKSLASSTSDCTATPPFPHRHCTDRRRCSALDCFIESLAPSTRNRTAASSLARLAP